MPRPLAAPTRPAATRGGVERACRWCLLLLSLSACVAVPTPPPAAPAPQFDAIAFFTGETRGEGRLAVIASRPRRVTVSGTGTVEPDGTLRLVQRVQEEGKPATTRTWRIRAEGNGRYAGTLSDADGPIIGETAGNRLHLRFRSKGGLATDQWLWLEPGGQVATNLLTARKLGIVVARLDETIRRTP